MDSFKLAGVTLMILIDKRRVRKNGTYPVKFRVTYRRKQAYLNTGIYLTEEAWNNVNSGDENLIPEKEKYLAAEFENVRHHISGLVKSGTFTIESLKGRVGKTGKISIRTAFSLKIEKLEGYDRYSSAGLYRSVLKSIYLFSQGENELCFSDITPGWLKRFEEFLSERGKSQSTIRTYLETVRTIMNEARRDKIITESQYPFGKDRYEIRNASVRRNHLSLVKLKELMSAELYSDRERKALDMWLFSYLAGGIRFCDMLRLRYSNIAYGEIHYHKAGRNSSSGKPAIVSATLLPEMRHIISKWGNSDRSPSAYLFPYLNDSMDERRMRMVIHNVTRQTTRYLRPVADAHQIERLTVMTARRSFATVLSDAGVSPADISDSLGNSSLSFTENYIEALRQEQRAKHALMLSDFPA